MSDTPPQTMTGLEPFAFLALLIAIIIGTIWRIIEKQRTRLKIWKKLQRYSKEEDNEDNVQASDFLHVKGKVAKSKKLLASPVSKTKCVLYEVYSYQEQLSSQGVEKKVTIAKISEATPFTIETRKGNLEVNPQNAIIVLSGTGISSTKYNPLPNGLEKIIDKSLVQNRDHGGGYIFWNEKVRSIGDIIEVYGKLNERPDTKSEEVSYRHIGRKKVIGELGTESVIITDYARKVLLKRLVHKEESDCK